MLNLRTTKFSLVIEFEDTLNKKIILTDDLVKSFICSDNVKRYYIIEHNKDIDDDGNLKRPHYHIVLDLYNPTTKRSVISSIAKDLKINKEIISCQGVMDITACMRYLTHKDDPRKYQYSDDEIIGNDPFYYDDIINYGDMTNIDIKDLYEIIAKSQTLLDVYALIGIKLSNRYRTLINDMWKEIKRGY